jgi:hypothetical protein
MHPKQLSIDDLSPTSTSSTEEVRQLLESASEEERQDIAEILDSEPTPDAVVKALKEYSQSLFSLRDPSYRKIVLQIAGKLNLSKHERTNSTNLTLAGSNIDLTPAGSRKDDNPKASTSKLEERISQHVFEKAWGEMTPAQRSEMNEKLKKTAAKFGRSSALAGSATAFGALTVANLSGFKLYLVASTSLGALTTGITGVSLPFAAYTAMSTAISHVLGPPGWLAVALCSFWGLSAPDYEKLVPAVIYVSILRAKQGGDFN